VTLTSSSATGNQWFLNNNPIGGATSNTYSATAAGSYTVTVTDNNGCTSAASAATVVSVTQPPTAATVGGNQSILANGTTAGLGGNTPTSGTGTWTVQSGGTGTFSNLHAGNSTFTHTGGAGPIVLRWTISTGAPCSDSFAQLSVSITVATPPTISKSFGATTIPVGGSTSLGFTIANTNASLAITGVGFTDVLPAGVTVANGSVATCGGGSLTTSGGTTITLTGGSIAAGASCSFSVMVTGTTAGVKNNTTSPVSANETGAGLTSNTATLTVLAPPTIAKSFGAATVPLNGTTTLTFTLTNPNATVALSGVGFTDTLPVGLTGPHGPVIIECGGALAVTARDTTITLTGATIPAGGNCTFSVNVTGITAGVQNNTTGPITSANGGTGVASNTAQITVLAPPTLTKAFGSSFVQVGQATTLSFTLTNPNTTVALTGVGFTDAFPAGLVVANPPSASDTCGGTFAPNAGDTSLTFSGGTIAAGGSCVISVSVQVTSAGLKTNTTGAITSSNGGTGGTSNTVTVLTYDKCLKDDTSGNYVLFSSATGDYRFVQCIGGSATLTGTGTVTTNGNVLTIIDTKPDRKVSISDFTNTTTGTAAITITYAPGVSQSFFIRDTHPNAVCSCGP
jgi:uncharacterized repeat protein (TIGR01451 family)